MRPWGRFSEVSVFPEIVGAAKEDEDVSARISMPAMLGYFHGQPMLW
jgi:hypothetical protein